MKKNIILIAIGVFLIVVMVLVVLFVKFGDDGKNEYKDVPLLSIEQFKDIKAEDIDSVIITKFTEGGDDSETVVDKSEINKIYSSINNIKLGKETDMSCTDNTTVYSFNLKSKQSIAIEFECDWVIVGDKRYLVE